MLVSSIFIFLAGIGVLLFGVHFMGTSMEKLLGANFRKKINKYAGNRFSCFGFGTLITFALQSSTASTAIFVSFASAGIITLFQGISLIIGCNVGTAISSFLLAFQSINLIEILASLVLVGVLMTSLAKNNVLVKNIGNALIGFGILFAGLVLVENGTAYFKTLDVFNNFILSLQNPFLLILIGTLLTVVLQSSLGSFAVLISLMATTGEAGLSVLSACYLVYGVNIGTCLTSIIAGISSGTDGKRVAYFHLLFNVLGTILFTILTLFTPLSTWIGLIQNPALQVLTLNLVFNLTTAIITIPFVTPLKKFMKLIVRRSKKEISNDYLIRSSELESPTLAIKKLNFQLTKLLDEYIYVFKLLNDYVLVNDTKNPKTLKKKLTELDENCARVYANSVKISGALLSQDSKNIIFAQQTVSMLQYILENYNKIISQMIVDDKKLSFGARRKAMLQSMFGKLNQIYSIDKEIYQNLYNENSSFDCELAVNKILEITDELSYFKTNDKRQIIYSLARYKTEVHTNIMTIINELADMKNSLLDMSVASLSFFDSTQVLDEDESQSSLDE